MNKGRKALFLEQNHMSKNYRHIYREKRSLINSEAHLRQYLDHRDIYGSTHDHAFLYSLDGVVEELHRDVENKKWQQLGYKLLNKNFVRRLLGEGRLLRSNLNAFVRKLKRNNLKKLTDNELISLFLKACQLFSRMRGYFKTSRPEFQSVAETKLKKLLFDKLNDEKEAQRVFEILTTPSAFDEINKEFFDWIIPVSKNSNLENLVFKHLYKYPWLVAQSYEPKETLGSY